VYTEGKKEENKIMNVENKNSNECLFKFSHFRG